MENENTIKRLENQIKNGEQEVLNKEKNMKELSAEVTLRKSVLLKAKQSV